jgi:hypothetical protein
VHPGGYAVRLRQREWESYRHQYAATAADRCGGRNNGYFWGPQRRSQHQRDPDAIGEAPGAIGKRTRIAGGDNWSEVLLRSSRYAISFILTSAVAGRKIERV